MFRTLSCKILLFTLRRSNRWHHECEGEHEQREHEQHEFEHEHEPHEPHEQYEQHDQLYKTYTLFAVNCFQLAIKCARPQAKHI